MKQTEILAARLPEPGTDPVFSCTDESLALESHLRVLTDRMREHEKTGGSAQRLADLRLQIARTLVALNRGEEAWPLGRTAFDFFMAWDQFELAADACDILFQAGQEESLAALGQGIWLAVTCPIDPELTFELLSHVIEETPDASDGAAVAAATALFLMDLRAHGRQREDLIFFATQMLAGVARRHSGIDSRDELDDWMNRLELKKPEKFLVRLRNVVDVLVQDNWWFERQDLQQRLPLSS